ncbi:protein PLANT CADMIUM RESISTANCE 2-like [Gossypium australe]|uniref:Protein PLANT CADMIUM RESISTANCE 2-like n=1 Tax=Gossypium australe TaxID=47621 RepID=A0A5B6VA78_9ROSI|nr:protein PLANT CADMIUM RESISTANCE 2-like [Gossypium australe]
MLEEKPCNDCCLHFCCECCALCQEHRDLTNRGFQMSLGWNGKIARQQNQGSQMTAVPVIESGMKK